MAKKRISSKKSLLRRKGNSYFRKKKYVEAQAKRMSKNMTWPEREFVKVMEELNIKCDAQKVISTKIFDFYLPEKHIVVEIHGDYYHANPLIYENKKTNKMQDRNVRNDKFKKTLAKGMGYKYEVVWEYDLKKNYNVIKEHFENL